MNVRLARPDDDAQIARIASEADLSVEPTRERCLSHARLFVGEQNGVVVGFVLGWLVADELELLDIAVSAPARRAGVASGLLTTFLQKGSEQGARSAFLEVRASNSAAQTLYRRAGFEEVGRRKGYYRGGEDALLFRYCFGPSSSRML